MESLGTWTIEGGLAPREVALEGGSEGWDIGEWQLYCFLAGLIGAAIFRGLR